MLPLTMRTERVESCDATVLETMPSSVFRIDTNTKLRLKEGNFANMPNVQ
jgi:hypothetical protein